MNKFRHGLCECYYLEQSGLAAVISGDLQNPSGAEEGSGEQDQGILGTKILTKVGCQGCYL